MKKKILFYCLFTFTFYSCNTDELITNSDKNLKEEYIQDIRSWLKSNNSPLIDLSNSTIIDWEKSVVITDQNRKIATVPLIIKKDYNKTNYKNLYKSYFKLVFERDNFNKYKISIIPSKNDLVTNEINYKKAASNVISPQETLKNLINSQSPVGNKVDVNSEGGYYDLMRVRFRLAMGGINVDLLSYKGRVSMVRSDVYGFSLGFSWTNQAQYIEEIGAAGGQTVYVLGTLNYNVFFESIGTVYSEPVLFTINLSSNGNFISAKRT
ncbi:hypothetical protein AAFH68_16900 [Flavobacterium sp. CGRL1]